MSLSWTASEQDRSVCMVKGKSEEFCQNYIKVVKKMEGMIKFVICKSYINVVMMAKEVMSNIVIN